MTNHPWLVSKLILKFIGYGLLTYYIILCGIANWTGRTQYIWFPWGSTPIRSYQSMSESEKPELNIKNIGIRRHKTEVIMDLRNKKEK